MKVQVTLRIAAGAAARQAVLSEWLAAGDAQQRAAVIAAGALAAPSAPAGVPVASVAGCPCCIGQVALRVTLTRLLRAHRLTRLLLLLGAADHAQRVRRMLGDEPFASVVRLAESAHGTDTR
jgi:hypothetical protein